VLRIAARRPPAALDPGASAGPGAGVIGQAGGLPDGCAQPEPAPLGWPCGGDPRRIVGGEGRLVCWRRLSGVRV